MKPEDIAKVCHAANAAYCEYLGDTSQKPWDQAEQWQRDSAVQGVNFRLSNPAASKGAQHEAWVKSKVADGWEYGPVKDSESKKHPCILPYDALPASQQAKDALFVAIVAALKDA